MSTSRRVVVLLGLLVLVAASVLPIGTWGQTYSGLPAPWDKEAAWWALTAALLAYILVVERKPLSSIGFKMPSVWDILLGAVATFVIFTGAGLIHNFVFPALNLKPAVGASAALTALPLIARVAIVTRAAVAEEIIFRGFGIERIKELTGSALLGGLITLAGFTYAHLSGWGAANLILVGWAGLVLTVFYLWRRNIWTVIIAHWLVDAVSVILGPMMNG